MKLISMTEFVLEVLNRDFPYNEVKMLTEISNYAAFLKQPLKLQMFVPCDEDGNVLKEPNQLIRESGYEHHRRYCAQYNEAQEKVLFEVEYEIGICNNKPAIWINGRGAQIIDDFKFLTVEDLSHWNFELTETAIKQIGLWNDYK